MHDNYPAHMESSGDVQQLVAQADQLNVDVRGLHYDGSLPFQAADGSSLDFSNDHSGQAAFTTVRADGMTITRSVALDPTGLRIFSEQRLTDHGSANPYLEGNYMTTERVWADSSGIHGSDFTRSEVQAGQFVPVMVTDAPGMNREKFAGTMLHSVRQTVDEALRTRDGQHDDTSEVTQRIPVIPREERQPAAASRADESEQTAVGYAGERILIGEDHPHYGIYMAREQARRAAMSGIPFANRHDALRYGAEDMASQLKTQELEVVPPLTEPHDH